MFTLSLIRFLCVLGFTLVPLLFVNAIIAYGICEGDEHHLAELAGTRWGALLVVGSIALAVMLEIVS